MEGPICILDRVVHFSMGSAPGGREIPDMYLGVQRVVPEKQSRRIWGSDLPKESIRRIFYNQESQSDLMKPF